MSPFELEEEEEEEEEESEKLSVGQNKLRMKIKDTHLEKFMICGELSLGARIESSRQKRKKKIAYEKLWR